MDLPDSALVLLAATLLLLSARHDLPAVLIALRPDSMRCSFEDGLDVQEMMDRSPELAASVRPLTALGFRILGVKAERPPLSLRPFREVALASRERDVDASVVIRPDARPASLFFFTPFRSGGTVFTGDFAPAKEFESQDTSAKNHTGGDAEAMLADHRRRLEVFKAEGRVPMVGTSQAERIEATRAFYASAYARTLRGGLLSPPVTGLVLSLVLFVMVVVWTLAGG